MSPPSRIRAATRGDLPEIVDLLNACDVADVGVPDTSSEDAERDWTMDGFDLRADAWVAVGPSGDLVGHAYTGDQYRTGELEADFWIHPEHDEPELAARLLGLAERRAREVAAARGYGDGAALDIFCIAVNRAKRDLLLRHDYALLRTVYRMAADLTGEPPPATTPPGLEIRPFRPGTDERLMHETMHEAFADHFRQSAEPFEAWQRRLMGHADFDPGLWFLAWDGGQAVGALIAYEYGDLGWVQGLGVRRPWRRRGLGGALLGHAFAEFARRGQRRLELGVDAEGATQPLRLYERAGMHVTFVYELFARRLAG
ncbi:MAG: GNAT family N-acetyltransferase [Thermoleophilia bacterium]